MIFAKFTSALVGPGTPIVIPREETRPDYEGEVAVVIGRRTYRADAAAARAAVGGISAMNDVSGRRAQLETPLRQFTLGKSFDTFAPMGPCVASADGVDLESIAIRTTVVGRGDAGLEHPEPDLLDRRADRLLLAGMTLEPGDVIATGTPGGVGDARKPPRYLRDGDVGRGLGRRRRNAPKPGRVRALSRGLPAAAPGLVAPCGSKRPRAPDVGNRITARACRRTSRRSFNRVDPGSDTPYRTPAGFVNCHRQNSRSTGMLATRGPPCTDARRRPCIAGSAAACGASRARAVDEAARLPGMLGGIHLPDRGRGAGAIAAHPGGARPPARRHDRRAGGPSRRGNDLARADRPRRDGRADGGRRCGRDAARARRSRRAPAATCTPQSRAVEGLGQLAIDAARRRAGRRPARAGARARAHRDGAAAAGPVRVARTRVRRHRRPLPRDLGAARGARGDAARAGRRARRDPVRRVPGKRVHRPGPVRRRRGRAGRRARRRGRDHRPDGADAAAVGDGADVRRAGPAAAGRAVHGRGRRPARGGRAHPAPGARPRRPRRDPGRPAPPDRGRRAPGAGERAHARRGRGARSWRR